MKEAYFPHLFNTDEKTTWDPYPFNYLPEGMSVTDRNEFRLWHHEMT